ncbi:SDR family NAD(P)-dependent oxidoreductase [Bradyrhizobium sp. Ash2021]|uniref:SDR family NAD(P)-dependent oxidoreductase n=1 Tax=Bradyrhizobium sp. Ash2021 TaxID=2954771 RepID=UPI002815E3E3|nr:SDR family NAD(P)-dependent oxidoreductase [Bradyrhizobium sp. Ash2021]
MTFCTTNRQDRRSSEPLRTSSSSRSSDDVLTFYLHQDVTVEQDWVEIVEEIENRYRRLDVLISNAGISIGAQSIVEMTLSDCTR